MVYRDRKEDGKRFSKTESLTGEPEVLRVKKRKF